MNILLIIIDCLRYDRVTPQYMPFLSSFMDENVAFTNMWSVSHCTDPVITCLLSGRWPDDLRLYSMMFEHKDYSIPEDVEMLAQTAKKNGYTTAMVSNLVRWYTRGVDHYVDNRGWSGQNTFGHTRQWFKMLPQPWFITVHDDSCHSNYRGGSYDRACSLVDDDLRATIGAILDDDQLRDDTYIIVTSDHGEGLGEHGIDMHGFGLWPVLTHVPLILRHVTGDSGTIDQVFQQPHIYWMMRVWMDNTFSSTAANGLRESSGYAHMVGRTPRWWHRGITDGKDFLMKEQDARSGVSSYARLESNVPIWRDTPEEGGLWDQARAHAALFDLNADDDRLGVDQALLEERLKNLGYFE